MKDPIILNVTFLIDSSLISKWKGFALELLEKDTSQKYSGYKIFKIMTYENQSPAYCIQFFFDNLGLLDDFYKIELPSIEDAFNDAFASDCLIVKTILKPEN